MNKLLLESIDNESRKGAINFLKANFNRCFPLEDQNLSPAEKEAKAKQYEENIELTYAEPWNIERACNWTKALIQGCVRILKTECNDESARPANERMIGQMHKLYFAAMMYRQKQVWDGVRKEDIMSKDMNGWSFYKLSSVVMPHYDEFLRIYNEGYGEVWPGKEAFRAGAIQRRREKEAADAARKEEIEAKIARGEELTAEEQNFMNVMRARAEREAARAVDQAGEVEEEGNEQAEDNPWTATDWQGHKPYMGNLFKVGDNGYYAVRITQKSQASTWYYWGWPNCPFAGQTGARWCICGPGTHFGGYGIGTRCVAYFIFKEGFQNLDRPMRSATAPNDEWGKSLMCLMVDEDTKPENDCVRNLTSRYNHYGPGEARHWGEGPQYGDGFLGRKVDALCTVLGITKQQFFELFPFKTDDNIDISDVMKKIVKGEFVDNRKFNFSATTIPEYGKFYKVYDRNNRVSSIFKDGRFIIPWCRDISWENKNNFFWIQGIKNNKRQFFDINGHQLLSDPIPENYTWHVNQNNILCLCDENKYSFYNLRTRRWITPTPIVGEIKYGTERQFPYLNMKNEETGAFEYKYYDSKSHKLVPVPLGFNLTNPIYVINKSFVIDDAVNAYCRKTGEKFDFSDDVGTYYINSRLSNEFFGVEKHYITADGKEVRLPSDETVEKTVTIGKKKITVTYERTRVNGDNCYMYRFYNTLGEKVYETVAIMERVHRGPDGTMTLTHKKPNDNTLYYTAVTLDGEVTSKTLENTSILESPNDGNDFFFFTNDGKIYGKNLEVIYDVGTPIRSVRNVSVVDPKYGWYRIGVTDTDYNNKYYMLNINVKKAIPLDSFESKYIPMGFGYIFLPGKHLTDRAKLVDDEGRIVFDDVYKFVTGFGTDGVASFKKRNRMLYVNIDNEMSDTMDELVESMERRRIGKILTEGTEVQQKLDWLDVAAYFC